MLTIDEQEIARLPVGRDPEVLSGALVFSGTRVPVEALLSNLEAGLTLDEFLENFPKVLEFSKSTLLGLGQAA